VREFKLLCLEKTRLWGDLITAFQYLNGGLYYYRYSWRSLEKTMFGREIINDDFLRGRYFK